MKSFYNYFKFPLWTDGIFVWDANDTMVATVLFENDNRARFIARAINGITPVIDAKASYSRSDQIVYMRGEPILMIRGFGHLTSQSGCNLSNDDACNIQDELGEWIAQQLNR